MNDDIAVAKQLQAEAEEIQTKIDNQLREAKTKTADLIKLANVNLQDHATNELDKLDKSIIVKLNEATSIIEKNKSDSLSKINDQIFDITKLTISKISNMDIDENDIKEVIKNIQPKVTN